MLTLDHCGRIPLLVKRGFTGEIISTGASVELARLVLLDSASLQESEARYRTKKASRHGNKKEQFEPLYNTVDVLNCFDCFGRKASYNEPLAINGGIQATFIDAGHILGSASIVLEVTHKGQQRKIIFFW